MEKLSDVKVLACACQGNGKPVWLRLGDYDSRTELIDELNRRSGAKSPFGSTRFIEYDGCPDWLPSKGLLTLNLAFMDVEDEDLIEAYALFIQLDGVEEFGNDAEKFIEAATNKMECKDDDSSLMDYAMNFMDDNNVPKALVNFVNGKKLLIDFAQYLLYDCTVVDKYYFSNH